MYAAGACSDALRAPTPPLATPMKDKGTLGIFVSTGSVKKDTCFAHSVQQGLAPFLRADVGPKKFDVAIGDPCAALEVARSEVLDSGASGSHLGFVACDHQHDLAKKTLQ